MQSGEPSRTARTAAFHRAAHQVLEEGRIFADPLALRILGEDSESVVRYAEEHSSGPRMRIFIAARTRFAEDALAAAVERGVRQLVVLGGLDTYAYRGELRERLQIFEVDHPATQAWKRQRLADAAIALPPGLTFAPIDFERETLAEGLQAAGFDPAQQTFFTWLGVVPYLTQEAVWSTLGYIASLPNGAHVVFDYSDPPDSLSPEMRDWHEKRAARVAELGEPWINYFEADALRTKLTSLGFSEIEDLGPPQIASRYFSIRVKGVSERGGHILRATTILSAAAAGTIGSRSSTMNDSHQRAAELHQLAAHAHSAAMEHHGKGDHQTGHEHSKMALEHSTKAFELAQEAHRESEKHVQKSS